MAPGPKVQERAARAAASRQLAPITPLSLDEVRARPVTLGIVLALGAMILGAVYFVFQRLETVRTSLEQLALQQAKDAAAINMQVQRVDGALKEQLGRIDE